MRIGAYLNYLQTFKNQCIQAIEKAIAEQKGIYAKTNHIINHLIIIFMSYRLKKKFRLVKKFYKRTFGTPLYVKYERVFTIKGRTYTIKRTDKVASGELMRKALITKTPITEEQVAAIKCA